MGSPLCEHLARLCLQCDLKLHSKSSVNNYNYSRIPLCNNCVSQTALVESLEQGLCLCQSCFSNPNVISRFLLLLRNDASDYSAYNFPLDLDSSSSSCSSSFIDRNWEFSLGSLPLNNEDSSSSFEILQIFEDHTKNYSDQQVLTLQPDYLDIIPKDSSCSGFKSYETKEDIENVLMNTFDGAEAAVLDLKQYNPEEDLILTELIDELAKDNSETTPTNTLPTSASGMSSDIHKDYNTEALANASSQDYFTNQMIGSKAKEETNDLAILPNALVQLDCGQSQLILIDEMLPWENQTFVPVKGFSPKDREEAKKRYFEKKKKRKFGKQIRYESRKSTADTKKRMKGRFTKAGADYDYDPRANDINKGKIQT
ncbi:CCT domain [Arabidopsis suecica]|uniref:CCT domain n=1 Tax=Arabidopsis suecica TaxID=45249 RepID=A0A8T2CCB8_ARASU|nr:CCT domain [Arabidopsis suecica]